MTPAELEALKWAEDVCSNAHSANSSLGYGKTLAALVRRLQARLESAEKVVEAARKARAGFLACMEAQKKDLPLPDGHDDMDESCGDGVCYRVGGEGNALDAALAAHELAKEKK